MRLLSLLSAVSVALAAGPEPIVPPPALEPVSVASVTHLSIPVPPKKGGTPSVKKTKKKKSLKRNSSNSRSSANARSNGRNTNTINIIVQTNQAPTQPPTQAPVYIVPQQAPPHKKAAPMPPAKKSVMPLRTVMIPRWRTWW